MKDLCVKGGAALWLLQLLGKDSWLLSVLIFCEENRKGAFPQKQAAKQEPEIRIGGLERRVSWLDWALGCHPAVGTHFSTHLQTTPTARRRARSPSGPCGCLGEPGWQTQGSQCTGDRSSAGEELGSNVCHCPSGTEHPLSDPQCDPTLLPHP